MQEAVVLLVDDEALVTEGLERALFAEPFRILSASSAREALRILAREHVDVIVSDEQMPLVSGSELLCEVRRRYPEIQRIMLTGRASLATTIRAINDAAVFRFLQKPCATPEMAATIHAALDARGARGVVAVRRDVRDDAFDDALGALSLALQPIVRCTTWERAAVEVLARVHHDAFPSILPLLETAERLRRMPDLERAIFQQIAGILPRLPAGLEVFVNAHPSSLAVEALWDERSPLAAWFPRLTIEVTERAMVHEGAGLDGVLAHLRARGARIALDDLGAGSSGLAALGAIRPDVVKLDMSLVRGVDTSSARREIVSSLIRLSHRLGMRVVAEGIETPGERDELVSLGCDLLQGYLMGRPAPLEAWGADPRRDNRPVGGADAADAA
ncbi:MAG: EAL domain-containing protein [Pseudomonadota bacterium]|nr:EAL domain-containing protein [Pseudomonadota bacterium]